jgi:hypothetical protein
MPKGAKVLAQSKRTAPPPIFNFQLVIFQFGILFLIEFQIGTILSKLVSKTLLNTKRMILLMGSFVYSKEKHLKQGEKTSNIENASQNLIHSPLTICKKALKRIYKRICKNKTNCASVVQNAKNKETIHAYLMKIYWFISK